MCGLPRVHTCPARSTGAHRLRSTPGPGGHGRLQRVLRHALRRASGEASDRPGAACSGPCRRRGPCRGGGSLDARQQLQHVEVLCYPEVYPVSPHCSGYVWSALASPRCRCQRMRCVFSCRLINDGCNGKKGPEQPLGAIHEADRDERLMADPDRLRTLVGLLRELIALGAACPAGDSGRCAAARMLWQCRVKAGSHPAHVMHDLGCAGLTVALLPGISITIEGAAFAQLAQTAEAAAVRAERRRRCRSSSNHSSRRCGSSVRSS